MRLGNGHAPRRHCDLRAAGQDKPFCIVQRQGRCGRLRPRGLGKQCGKARKTISANRRLRAANTGRHCGRKSTHYTYKRFHCSLQRRHSMRAVRAISPRIGARRRTKAKVQPAKEGVLDSEYEDAARRELRRLDFESIAPCVTARDERRQAARIGNDRRLLGVVKRKRRSRSDGGDCSADLAARRIHADTAHRASLSHIATAGGPRAGLHHEHTSGGRHRSP